MGSRKKKQGLLTAGIMVMTILCIILTFFFQKRVDSVMVPDGLHYYFGEKRIEFPGTCRISYEEGVVRLKNDQELYELDSTPLYNQEGNVILPYDYIWNNTATGHLFRLEHFSEIKQENSSICLVDGSRRQEKARGFLYDGVDTYIFLEHVTVTAGDTEVQLPAMSYAVARYGNTLQYYHPGQDSSTVVRTGEGEQLARLDNGDTLNMGTDTLYLNNGTWQLLVVRPQVLDRMDQEEKR